MKKEKKKPIDKEKKDRDSLEVETSCGHGIKVLTGLDAWAYIIFKDDILCDNCESKKG